MTSKNVIKILDSIQIINLPTEKDLCQHIRIELVIERRMIRCQDCKCYLEPFDYLLHYGNRYINMSKRISSQRKEELKILCDEVEKLKRERRNLKASIKRFAKKTERDKWK